ncbi:MAG TPA: DUF5666 domain-containing protein [Burkholderiales bacterium]|nr:DUF5666 domain-containing protein [Burkholderiales bacterium]
MRWAALALALFVSSGNAQERVRGVISAVSGDEISVGDKKVRVGDKTELVYTQPIVLGDIKPGSFLAVTSQKGPDGQLSAIEVRVQPRPISPGHRPFDGRDDQTMTNANLDAMVQASTGRELTLSYPGGSQKILVPESAALFALVPGNRSQLVPGAPVNLTHDAGGVALRVQVGPKR